jgi:CheY-like chemotaxis protein
MHAIVTDLLEYQESKAEPKGPEAPQAEIDLEDLLANSLITTPATSTAAASDIQNIEDHDEAQDGDGSESQLPSFEVKAIQQKRVLCVEAQSEIQDALRKTLSSMGFRALITGDAEAAVERYAESDVDAVIFDCDGFGPDSTDFIQSMHQTAQETERPFLCVVLLGPKQRDLSEQIPDGESLVVLVKPIKMKQLQDAITQLLPSPHR